MPQATPNSAVHKLAAGRTWRALPADLRLAADVHRKRLTGDCLAAATLATGAAITRTRTVEQDVGGDADGGVVEHGGRV